MDDRSKVVIRLTDVGSRPHDVLKVLQKIQGLQDTPETLVAQAPCDISQEVARPLAEKVRMYLERAGASVSLRPFPDAAAAADLSGDDDEDEGLKTLTSQFVSVNTQETGSTAYDTGPAEPMMEEDITYFDVEEPDSGVQVAAYEQSEPSELEEAAAAPPPAPPARRPRRPKARRTRRSRPLSRRLLPFGIGLLAFVVLAGGIWWYFSGGASRIVDQYQEGAVPGGTGRLIIDNPAEADISLHHMLATRVSEPVPLVESPISLPRGDYFVEARLNGQPLRYPVYIAGRGHTLRVSVRFPAAPVPDDMAYIPAGWFRMGNKETDIPQFGFPDEVPSIDVYVGAFLMSRHEVTNRQYAQFIDEGGYTNELYWDELLTDWDSLVRQAPDFGRVFGQTGWEAVARYIRTQFVDTDLRPGPRLWEDDIPPYEDGQAEYPVTAITYYEAAAFCRWLTQKQGRVHRLPTEAEWEKAARSYEGYFFSYGNEYDGTRANTESEGPQRVGSYPPNGFGVYDLTGNVWEWVSDHYREDTYQFWLDTYGGDIRNPRMFNAAQAYDRRILRGGSFRSVNRINAKATIRYPMFPNDWHTNIGFRYVTTP